MKWKEAKKLLLKNDPMLKIELERLEPKYQVIRQVIELRKTLDLSQQELAKRINDKQSNIARLENGNANPSIEKLTRLAEGLNAELEIKLIPRS
ncbi:MAG: helix-turn-helix transcriptional regulator [Actinobacteria bacterium]|nr:helix-turn-helix transcriptional regulator [Actinomycetota bacterium]